MLLCERAGCFEEGKDAGAHARGARGAAGLLVGAAIIDGRDVKYELERLAGAGGGDEAIACIEDASEVFIKAAAKLLLKCIAPAFSAKRRRDAGAEEGAFIRSVHDGMSAEVGQVKGVSILRGPTFRGQVISMDGPTEPVSTKLREAH